MSVNPSRTRTKTVPIAITFILIVGYAACVPLSPPPPNNGNGVDPGPMYNNTTDSANKGATYVGSDACRACHPSISALQIVHGHAHKLTRTQGEPPVFPEEGIRAGVPNPPEGFEWADISWVIGGYIRKARFIDNDGFILTTGVDGVDTQWNLSFPANGTTTGFAPYHADQEAPKPYDFSCFQCHTTGPMPQDEDFPEFQENRPGFIGTWSEEGVQCEACHGPGSNHIPNPQARDIFVGVGANECGRCHTRGDDPNVIQASGGYVRHHEQWPELLSSGAHSSFNCTTCHKPHVSVNYERENGIRNECTSCHAEQNMAIHDGKALIRGDYVEILSCESCHMPFATKSATAASVDTVGELGRMGDTRTHIFRIDASPNDYTAMFTEDGGQVVKDASGRAAVTVDFTCLRCHNGVGNAFELSIESAASIARGMHGIQR